MRGFRVTGCQLKSTLSLGIATLLLSGLIVVEAVRLRHERGSRHRQQQDPIGPITIPVNIPAPLEPEYVFRVPTCGEGPRWDWTREPQEDPRRHSRGDGSRRDWSRAESNGTDSCDEDDYDSPPTARIAHGWRVRRGDFPSYVSIRIRDDRGASHICNGVLVDDDIVLTIASCFEKLPIYSVEVSPSISPTAHWEEDKAPIYEGLRVCRSPMFVKGGLDFNYAVIRLIHQIPMTKEVNVACLPYRDSQVSATVVGQGAAKVPNKADPSTWVWPRNIRALALKRVGCLPDPRNHQTVSCFTSRDDRDWGDVCEGDKGAPVYILQRESHVVSALNIEGEGDCSVMVKYQSRNADLMSAPNVNYIKYFIRGCIEREYGMIWHNPQVDG